MDRIDRPAVTGLVPYARNSRTHTGLAAGDRFSFARARNGYGALAPSGGKLVFTLRNWDQEEGAVDAPILNGGIDVQLLRTQSSERGHDL